MEHSTQAQVNHICALLRTLGNEPLRCVANEYADSIEKGWETLENDATSCGSYLRRVRAEIDTLLDELDEVS
jgi:hypothetical protein